MVYSFVLGGRSIDDPNYDPYPEQSISTTIVEGGGTEPAHALLAKWHRRLATTLPTSFGAG